MVVYEESDVRAIYDPTREWEYSMEKIMGIDEPMVTTQAVLNRPLNGFKVPCAHIEDVMQEAFENDAVNCVIRQICAKYCFERLEVEAEFDDIAQTIAPERAEGITAIQIMEWCKRHDFNAYIIWNGALVAKYEAPNKDRHDLEASCLQIVGGHAYFMTNARRWKDARVSTMQPKLP